MGAEAEEEALTQAEPQTEANTAMAAMEEAAAASSTAAAPLGPRPDQKVGISGSDVSDDEFERVSE
eukprot:6225938-Pyramimonas_sp.AAC.1